MDLRRYRRRAVVTLGALAAVRLLLSSIDAFGNPVRLDCSLRDIETRKGAKSERLVGAENRSITVEFDEEQRILTVYEDGSARVLHDVTITQTSINGALDQVSLGMDRSSGSIVFQTYGPDSMRAEFGACTLSTERPP